MNNEDATFEALQLCLEIDEDGNKFYYNHKNELHRKFGPAVIYADGAKWWCLNGKLHRTDGPAIEWFDGTKGWHINNQRLSEYEFLKHPLCTIK